MHQPFKFALAFSMLQVSSSYSHKHKKWIRNKSVTKKTAFNSKSLSQPGITYSKLAIGTLEQGVKYAQSYQKTHGIVLVFLLISLSIFHILFHI